MQIYLPIERPGQPRRMRHHQEAAAGTLHQIARKREDVIRGGLVKIAGGLIGEQKQRLYRQRAADRNPLLLTARQLFGVAPEQARLARAARPVRRARRHRDRPAMRDWNSEVVQHVQAWDQVELLKHQTEPVPSQRRPFGIGEAGNGAYRQP